MKARWKSVIAEISMCVLLPWFAMAQQDTVNAGARTSLAFRAGYGLPMGEWAKSRIAPEVQLFSGDLTVEGDITIRLGRRWGLVIGGGYWRLNGSKWEEYALSKGGQTVSVSGSVAQVSVSFRPYLLATPTDHLSFEFGATGLFAGGEERFDGEWYDDDFFSTFRFGFQGALEYDRLVSSAVAFTVRAGIIVAPDGMNYADGESRTIMYVPLTAGIRFLF